MSKVLTVIRKEYLERVKSKAFLIGTLLGPLFMGGLVIGPALLADVAGRDDAIVGAQPLHNLKIQIIAQPHLHHLYPSFPASRLHLDQQLKTTHLHFHIHRFLPMR